MPDQHLFISLDTDGTPFRVPLADVQEIIRLEGHFESIDASAKTVGLRRRTVRIVDPESVLGVRADRASIILVFEHNYRLHGLPVSRVDREPRETFRELRLRDLNPYY
ncbi:MAG: chemotaxis signal transduction protein [Rhodothermales bacterium]|jgi:chemotaxis signal transduction protein